MRRTAIALTIASLLAAPAAAQVRSVPLPPSTVADGYDSDLGRDIGRAAGSMTLAARRAAAQARIMADQVAREYRQGYAEGVGEFEDDGSYVVDENEAVDRCVEAAQDEGLAVARIATVRDIVDVDRLADGWDVEGTIELRQGYRDSRREEYRFSCAVRADEGVEVRIADLTAGR